MVINTLKSIDLDYTLENITYSIKANAIDLRDVNFIVCLLLFQDDMSIDSLIQRDPLFNNFHDVNDLLSCMEGHFKSQTMNIHTRSKNSL